MRTTGGQNTANKRVTFFVEAEWTSSMWATAGTDSVAIAFREIQLVHLPDQVQSF